MSDWTHTDLAPDALAGRTLVVTGGNSGIGFEAARMLADRGARVVLACRNPDKAREAEAAIRAQGPEVQVESLPLDLASLASVRDFDKRFRDRHDRLDVLVNNAGVMALPLRRTADGFEMQIGTNHLGHFALTGLLLDLLLATRSSRVVNVSSTMHKIGRVDTDDLNYERRRYSKWGAYGQSKLANLLFTYELQRRLEAAGRAPDTLAVACHPGYAATNLQTAGPRMEGSRLMEQASLLLNRIASQPPEMGALPTVFAAAAPEVAGGDYIGPGGFQEMWGHPRKVDSTRRSKDEALAGRLWTLSEELTRVRYDALDG